MTVRGDHWAAILQAIPTPQKSRADNTQATLSESPRGRIVPALCAWAHELWAGTADRASYSSMRITCSNLVEAGDDFGRQYS
jgi:hypothetical protein